MATANFTQICAEILALNDKTKALNQESLEINLKLEKAKDENNLLKADLIEQIAKVSAALSDASLALEIAKSKEEGAITNTAFIQSACDEIVAAQDKVKGALSTIMEALVLADENVVFIKQTKDELGALCDDVKADLNSLAEPTKAEFSNFVEGQKSEVSALVNEIFGNRQERCEEVLGYVEEAISSAEEIVYKLDNSSYRHEARFESLLRSFDKVAFDTELLGAMIERVSISLMKEDSTALNAELSNVEIPQSPSIDINKINELEAQVNEQKTKLAELLARLETSNEI